MIFRAQITETHWFLFIMIHNKTIMNSNMAANGEAGGKVEDPALLEMQKLVKDAFSIFDHENNDTVDMREVGTIIRCESIS